MLVHVDGYDDSRVESIYNISRSDVELIVTPLLSHMTGNFKKTQLRIHHLNGKNIVEIYLHGDRTKTITETAIILKKFKGSLLENKNIDGVKLYLEVEWNMEKDHSIK